MADIRACGGQKEGQREAGLVETNVG